MGPSKPGGRGRWESHVHPKDFEHLELKRGMFYLLVSNKFAIFACRRGKVSEVRPELEYDKFSVLVCNRILSHTPLPKNSKEYQSPPPFPDGGTFENHR